MFEQLFSTNGVIIVVCATIILGLVLLFLLSFRYPAINIGAGSYKIALERKSEPTALPSEVSSVSAIAVPPTKEAADKSSDQTASDSHWYIELRDAVKQQDRRKIEKIFAKFKESPPFGESPNEIEVWKYAELLRSGFDDALKSLERIEKEEISETHASQALARYYLRISSPVHAKAHVDKMLARSTTDAGRCQALLLKVECIEEDQSRAKAIEFLKSELSAQYSEEINSELYSKLGELYAEEQNNEYAVAAYEKALSCNIRNKNARFKLAYIYGQMPALKKLALRHYRILLAQDRGQALAQNNLGVEYESWGLQTKKISAWKESREKGEGYALGNLALAYLEAGYSEEAQQLLDAEDRSWIKSADRVVFAQQRIQHVAKEEEKKLDEILESAEAVWNEIHKIEIEFHTEPFIGIGSWNEIDGEASLTISHSGQILKIEVKGGSYIWTGFASKITGYTIIDVRRESERKDSNSLAAGLLFSGPFDAGQYILIPTRDRLEIIHVEGGVLVSHRSFSRVLAKDQ